MASLFALAIILSLDLAYRSQHEQVESEIQHRIDQINDKKNGIINKYYTFKITDYIPTQIQNIVNNWSMFDMLCMIYVIKEAMIM